MISATKRPGLAPGTVENQIFGKIDPTTTLRLAVSIEPLLTKADLAKILRVNSRTIDRMRSAGKLPKPDLLLERSGRWRAETIRRWIESGGAS